MIELYRTFVRKIKTKLNQPLIFPQFWLHNRIRGGKVSRIILRPAQHLNLSNVRRRKSHQKRRVYSLWAGDCLFPPLSLPGWKGFPEREGTARLVSGVFLKTNVRRVGFGETISLLPPHLVMHVYYSWRHPVSVAWLNQLFFFWYICSGRLRTRTTTDEEAPSLHDLATGDKCHRRASHLKRARSAGSLYLLALKHANNP